jgi:hypothetical protein
MSATSSHSITGIDSHFLEAYADRKLAQAQSEETRWSMSWGEERVHDIQSDHINQIRNINILQLISRSQSVESYNG